MADEPDIPAFAGLVDALRAQKTRFILIGMSAAIVQGVPGSTFDVDLWIDLPSRQYMKPMNAALKLGGEMIRQTVVILPGDLMINFVYAPSGLRSFDAEYRNARQFIIHRKRIPVLPLDRIRKSKLAAGRPKDEAHIRLIDEALSCQKALPRKKR